MRIALAALALLAGLAHAQSPAPYDRVILGGTVMDPASGLNAVRNVGLRDGRIAAVTTAAISGRDTIAARGLVVAPGFIDLHAHGQTDETYRFQARDGVTSSFELELGTADVAAWYAARARGQRINYGVSIGHIKVRMAVLHDSGSVMPVGPGAYAEATAADVAEIARRLQAGLDAGAVSVGAGFTYTPAASRDELLAVFRVAARAKTPVHVHTRSGVAGLTEAIALARETGAPLHVVHINSAGNAETPPMLAMIADAQRGGMDITTEAYPYTAGMTEIQSATIQDMFRGAADSTYAQLEWPRTGERMDRARFAHFSAIGGPVVIHRNTEPMVTAALASPSVLIASDAYWQDGTGHPRTTGTFSRVLGRYARDRQALSLMDALRKMTIMPAQRLEARVPAMRRKGRVAVGADADITIFDARTVLDRSTYREPVLPPVGIVHVLVQGVSVVADGASVEGVTPGRAIRASVDAPAVPPALIGTWLLVSRLDRTADGRIIPEPSLGSDPVAMLMYDTTGHVAAQLMRRTGRTASSTAPAATSSSGDANNSAAIGGYDAYFGTYRVDLRAGTVTHHFDAALNPADVGREVTRRFRFDGEELLIEFDTRAATGEQVTRTLRWRRASAAIP